MKALLLAFILGITYSLVDERPIKRALICKTALRAGILHEIFKNKYSVGHSSSPFP